MNNKGYANNNINHLGQDSNSGLFMPNKFGMGKPGKVSNSAVIQTQTNTNNELYSQRYKF